jgi:hypothetical protein
MCIYTDTYTDKIQKRNQKKIRDKSKFEINMILLRLIE